VLSELLTEECIQFLPSCKDWDEALHIVAQPLLQAQKIDERYVHVIRENISNGKANYLVLREGFALPHARPEDGVNETGMSLLKLEDPVYFNDDPSSPIYLIVLIASIDSETHLRALSTLVEYVAEDEDFEQLKEMKHKIELLTLMAE